jgi:transcriptional regulator with XRE-family HTH domain
MMHVGDKIQQLRKASGLSQEQLAEQLDVSRQSVSKWELNESVPDVRKIVMISELFSVSTDELLKENKSEESSRNDESDKENSTIEEIAKINLAHKQILMGFVTIVIGLIMFVLEFMFLPVFGTMQKEQASGHGFYSHFMDYASVQPMPTIFKVTFMIIMVGLAFMLKGYFYKKRNLIK